MSDFFDEHHKQYDAWYDRNKFAYLSELEAVKKALPREGYGLEVGVGSGRFAAPLGIAVGIDPSKKMVELARKRGVDARPGSGEALPFEDAIFDYVAIIVTLCFVSDPGQVIGESARVLKGRGRIIIGIVDKDSFLGESYREKKSAFYEQAHFFSAREVSAMLKEAGFGEFSYYQTLFDLPDKMSSVAEPREGFGHGGFVVVSGVKRG